ncbi:MAG: SMP-30/gluconolactonase/LRE family protein [Betaproteobacteria bacterium]
MIHVEVALDAHAELGEGPVWDERRACLFWVDIMRGLVHQFDPDTGVDRSIPVGQPVGAVMPTTEDDLVLAVRDGFARLDPASGAMRMIAAVDADRPERRMNDGNCDAAGRFWAGTMAIDERPGAGALYCLDPDGRVRTMLTGVTISNGLDWSDDGRVMYYVDTGSGRVDCLDVDPDTGDLGGRRGFVQVPADCGAPDGLTIDSEGGVWIALWGGSAVHRYSPDGRLVEAVRLPVTHPTSCAFGGPDLRDFYITTASTALTAGERAAQPLAGAIFRCRPGVAGRRAHRFGAAR